MAAATRTPIKVTVGQSTILRAFIDQVSAFKFNNQGKQIKKLTLVYDAVEDSYSIDMEEEPTNVG